MPRNPWVMWGKIGSYMQTPGPGLQIPASNSIPLLRFSFCVPVLLFTKDAPQVIAAVAFHLMHSPHVPSVDPRIVKSSFLENNARGDKLLTVKIGFYYFFFLLWHCLWSLVCARSSIIWWLRTLPRLRGCKAQTRCEVKLPRLMPGLSSFL